MEPRLLRREQHHPTTYAHRLRQVSAAYQADRSPNPKEIQIYHSPSTGYWIRVYQRSGVVMVEFWSDCPCGLAV